MYSVTQKHTISFNPNINIKGIGTIRIEIMDNREYERINKNEKRKNSDYEIDI